MSLVTITTLLECVLTHILALNTATNIKNHLKSSEVWNKSNIRELSAKYLS